MYIKTKKIIQDITKKSVPLILLIFALSVTTSVLGLLNPILYSKIIDEVIPEKRTDQLIFYLLLLMTVPCLSTLTAGVKKYFSAKLGDRYTGKLRKECFRRVVYAKMETLEDLAPAQLVSRITKECGRVGEVYITNDLMTALTETVTFLSVLITMLTINAKLSLLCVAAFPLSALITRFVSKRAKAMDGELIKATEYAQRYLTESFGAIRTIKLKNGCERELAVWERWLADYKRIRQKSCVVHDVNRFFMGDLITNVIYGILFFYSGILVMKGEMSVGEMVTFIAFVPKVYASVRNVLNIRVATGVVSNSFEKIEEMLTLNGEKTEGEPIGLPESIEFRHVGFSYNRADFSVTNLNLKIRKGEKVGIVGDSGGGKSTLFDLLTALYLPQNGEIRINGKSTAELSAPDLRKHIAVVTQDTELLSGTIRHNLTYPQDSEKDVASALHQACLADFVASLPEGLNTQVGERGSLLSGGERQRIGIANALLRRGEVYLLDEFTSALDTKTEEKIVNEILRLDATVLMISHRVYNVMKCDRVLVMQNGRIVEEGIPSELVRDERSKFYDIYKRTVAET